MTFSFNFYYRGSGSNFEPQRAGSLREAAELILVVVSRPPYLFRILYWSRFDPKSRKMVK